MLCKVSHIVTEKKLDFGLFYLYIVTESIYKKKFVLHAMKVNTGVAYWGFSLSRIPKILREKLKFFW